MAVSEGVVDLFEAVEVDEEYGARPGEIGHQLVESGPVRQAGEPVVVGVVAQLTEQSGVLQGDCGMAGQRFEQPEVVGPERCSLVRFPDEDGPESDPVGPDGDEHRLVDVASGERHPHRSARREVTHADRRRLDRLGLGPRPVALAEDGAAVVAHRGPPPAVTGHQGQLGRSGLEDGRQLAEQPGRRPPLVGVALEAAGETVEQVETVVGQAELDDRDEDRPSHHSNPAGHHHEPPSGTHKELAEEQAPQTEDGVAQLRGAQIEPDLPQWLSCS